MAKKSFGSKAADWVTDVYGSWKAIFAYIFVLFIWVIFNTYFVYNIPHIDPYPFTFLNLLLAIVGAVTPIFILMSQNQSAARDQALLEMAANSSTLAQSNLSYLSDELFHIRTNQEIILLNQHKIMNYYSGSPPPDVSLHSADLERSGTPRSTESLQRDLSSSNHSSSGADHWEI